MNQIFASTDSFFIQTSPDTHSGSSFPAEHATDEYISIALDGDFYSPSRAYRASFSDTHSPSIPLAEALDATGEWVGLFERAGNPRSYIIIADPLGYNPVFYAKVDDGVVISASFPSISATLNRFGIQARLNLPYYVTSLLNTHPHFDNPDVGQTMHPLVRILAPNEALIADSGGVRTISRSSLYPQKLNQNYEELLAKGIQTSEEIVQNLVTQGTSEPRISLSGGVDSRLVFALVKNAGALEKFQLATVDPRTWKTKATQNVIDKDMLISDHLRRLHGLDWASNGERIKIDFDFWDALEFYSGYRSNFSYNFTPMTSLTVSANPITTLRGGGGEMLRSTLTGARIKKAVQRRAKTQSSDTDRLLTNWYIQSNTHSRSFRDYVYSSMFRAFEKLPGSSIEEKMNYQYLFGRNRTHFGHGRISATTQNSALHLLSNAYFMQSREHMNFEDRSQGKLVADIYAMTDPTLLHIPFENEESTEKLCTPPLVNSIDQTTSWMDALDAKVADSGKITSEASWAAARRGIESPYNGVAASAEFLRRGFRTLEDFVHPDDLNIIHKLHFEALRRSENSTRNLHNLVGKLSSALDVFLPNDSAPKITTLRVSDYIGSNSGTEGRPTVRELRSSVSNGWHNTEMSGLIVHLEVEAGEAVVKVESAARTGYVGEFAVYLYANGKRVDKSWFSTAPKRSFPLQEVSGTIQAEVFLRKTSLGRPSYGFRSKQVRLPLPEEEA